MNTAERISFGIILLIGGFAAGMYVEHQRFLREMQSHVKEHAKNQPTTDTPTPQPEAAA